MKKLYEDFGDVFNTPFKKWWKEELADGTPRGMHLFAESALTLPKTFATLEDIETNKEAIKAGDALVILLPSHQTRTDMVRLTKNILKEYGKGSLSSKTFNTSIARYKLSRPTKNSTRNLRDGLRALDMREQGHTYREIGQISKWEMQYDKVWSGEEITWRDVKSSEMTCHVHATRLYKRAKANIEAVENAVASEGERRWESFPVKLRSVVPIFLCVVSTQR